MSETPQHPNSVGAGCGVASGSRFHPRKAAGWSSLAVHSFACHRMMTYMGTHAGDLCMDIPTFGYLEFEG